MLAQCRNHIVGGPHYLIHEWNPTLTKPDIAYWRPWVCSQDSSHGPGHLGFPELHMFTVSPWTSAHTEHLFFVFTGLPKKNGVISYSTMWSYAEHNPCMRNNVRKVISTVINSEFASCWESLQASFQKRLPNHHILK